MRKDWKETIKNTTSLATAASRLALTAAGGKMAVEIAAALALLPSLVGLALPRIWARKVRQAKDWWDEVVREEGADRGVAASLKSRLSEPDAQEVISDAFQRVLESAAAVVPALAMLTREYLREQKAPDRFFIDFGRFLSGLSADEYPEVQLLLTSASKLAVDDRSFVELWMREPAPAIPPLNDQPMSAVGIVGLGRTGNPGSNATETPVCSRTGFSQRLFQLLKQHGLGRDSIGGIFGSSEAGHLLIEKDVAKRMARLLV